MKVLDVGAQGSPLAVAGLVQTFDLPLGDPESADQLGKLQRINTYWCWSQAYAPHEQPLRLLEWTQGGIADATTDHYSFHVVRAGTPHFIDGVFGYWLISDADHIWIQVPREDRRYYVLIAGGKTGVNLQHSVTWYCQECSQQLGQPRALLHDGSPEDFLRAQADAVDQFNSSEAGRTCTACGSTHPAAYGFRASQPGSQDAAVTWVAPALSPLPVARSLPIDVSEIPADRPVLVSFEGQDVALVRNGERIHAVANVCPHKGGPLAHGEFAVGSVTCPWHRFRFDLETGVCATNPNLSARVFDVFVQDGRVSLTAAALQPS